MFYFFGTKLENVLKTWRVRKIHGFIGQKQKQQQTPYQSITTQVN
jgi:hypothetical protein